MLKEFFSKPYWDLQSILYKSQMTFYAQVNSSWNKEPWILTILSNNLDFNDLHLFLASYSYRKRHQGVWPQAASIHNPEGDTVVWDQKFQVLYRNSKRIIQFSSCEH